MPLDIDRVRAEYPALREGFAHFDGAAGTLVAARSSDAISEVTRGAVANKTHRVRGRPAGAGDRGAGPFGGGRPRRRGG